MVKGLKGTIFDLKAHMTSSRIYKICSINKEYAYAGISSNVDSRILSHTLGKGCSWTREHNINTLIESSPAINRWDENVATLQLMAEYGIDHVRGGYFVMSDLDYPITNRAIIVGLLRSMHDLCANCGDENHYANQCSNPHNVDYTLRKEDTEFTHKYGECDQWFDGIAYTITPMITALVDDNHDILDKLTTPRKLITTILRHVSQA